MTPIFSAEPWLKFTGFAAMNASALPRSDCGPKSMAGLLQEPKSRAAARARILVAEVEEMAALQAVSCVSHCDSPPERVPALAALAHWLCWTEQERWRAAPLLTNVEPSVEKGRSEPEVKMTGGAEMPPRAPVKVCTLEPDAADPLLGAAPVGEAEQTEAGVAAAGVLDGGVDAAMAATLETLDGGGIVIIIVTVTAAGQEPDEAGVATTATGVGLAAAGVAAALLEAGVAADIPATAELISAGVASSTRRFWVKIQPIGSLVVSQLFPLPVVSAS